jgi:Ig-like domain-containing protein
MRIANQLVSCHIKRAFFLHIAVTGGLLADPERALAESFSLSYDFAGNQISQQTAVAAPPTILGSPTNQVVLLGGTGGFSVNVASPFRVTYQWYFNGVAILGAAGDSLLLTNVTAADEGDYSVTVTNSSGSVTSGTYRLNVEPPKPTPTPTPMASPIATPTATATPNPTPTTPPTASPTSTPTPSPTPGAQAINLSTRMRVRTGDDVGIGGFIIVGTAPKHVLIRAIGPSLTQFGIPTPLLDPVLELHGPAGFVTIANNNWRDDPAQEAVIMLTGLAPTNDLESAIDASLNPGAYTAVVRGKHDTSGVALIEVYDLSQAVAAKLANISTRAFVGTGDDIVIAGLILGNHNGGDRIVIRGIGPSLTFFGVPNVLADPTLELRDTNGALLVANNDWQDDPAQAAELIVAGLAPTNQLESGIAMTLQPGLYTALLAGLNNGMGNGVVEVYDRGGP